MIFVVCKVVIIVLNYILYVFKMKDSIYVVINSMVYWLEGRGVYKLILRRFILRIVRFKGRVFLR